MSLSTSVSLPHQLHTEYLRDLRRQIRHLTRTLHRLDWSAVSALQRRKLDRACASLESALLLVRSLTGSSSLPPSDG